MTLLHWCIPKEIGTEQQDSIEAINQSKRKTSYAKRSLKTKQHTTPDELESHKPIKAGVGKDTSIAQLVLSGTGFAALVHT